MEARSVAPGTGMAGLRTRRPKDQLRHFIRRRGTGALQFGRASVEQALPSRQRVSLGFLALHQLHQPVFTHVGGWRDLFEPNDVAGRA